ncbi:MAG: chloride channel protein, partial [Bdellovibrionales bacterium]|nr:chloride channel protein [Bdellovibrionales bacterium]
MKKLKYLFPNSWNLIFLSSVVGMVMYFAADLFLKLIHLISNLCFSQSLNLENTESIQSHHLIIIFVPIIGSLFLGALARYYDDRIRGHGIPEVIVRIESFKSEIPLRLLWLRPIASAISIGTGGPYGAEGPVIGMGAALGSAVARLFNISHAEKKILLAAGAAAGISAVFGTPVGAVFLVTELFLRSHSIKSLIPIGLASLFAFVMRTIMMGAQPLFPLMPTSISITMNVILGFALMAIFLGLVAAFSIHTINFIEKLYEKLPVHWMWWPVIGVIPLSISAYFFPNLLGPSYELLSSILSSQNDYTLLIKLSLLKGVVWMFAVSSRTTGGTLAPLLIFGSGVGLYFFSQESSWLSLPPSLFTIAALLGGGAFFGSISGAPISSALMVLEMTGSLHLLPLSFGTCLIAVLVT